MKYIGFLGLYFIIKKTIVWPIWPTKKFLKIGRGEVSLISENVMGCYKILMANSLTTPPRSEIIASSNICPKENDPPPKGVWLIETDETLVNCDRGLVGKMFVDTKKGISIRILNLSLNTKIYAW